MAKEQLFQKKIKEYIITKFKKLYRQSIKYLSTSKKSPEFSLIFGKFSEWKL